MYQQQKKTNGLIIILCRIFSVTRATMNERQGEAKALVSEIKNLDSLDGTSTQADS